jgi:hypothetical protein
MAYKLVPQEQPKEQSLGKTLSRIPGQAAAATGAVIAGIPGSTLQAANQLTKPIVKAMGGTPKEYSELPISKIFPTTEEHLKRFEEKFPSLKPKNDIEKFSQDVVKNAEELFLPGKYLKMGKYALGKMRSFGISLASNTLGKGTEEFTGDKKKGEMVKNGSMLFLSLFNPTSAKDVASNLYSKSESLLSPNATDNAMDLLNGLSKVEHSITRGRSLSTLSSAESSVIKEVNKVLDLIQNGQVNIKQLIAQKKSLNSTLNDAIYKSADKIEKAGLKNQAKRLNGVIRESMESYGKKNNPEWLKAQMAADQAFGAISKSNFISKTMEKLLKGKSEGLAHLFGIGLPAGLSFFSPIGAIATTAGYQAAKIGSRIVNSPELRKHYAKVVGAAAADNTQLAKKELGTLEEKLKKQDKGKYKLKSQK